MEDKKKLWIKEFGLRKLTSAQRRDVLFILQDRDNAREDAENVRSRWNADCKELQDLKERYGALLHAFLKELGALPK